LIAMVSSGVNFGTFKFYLSRTLKFGWQSFISDVFISSSLI